MTRCNSCRCNGGSCCCGRLVLLVVLLWIVRTEAEPIVDFQSSHRLGSMAAQEFWHERFQDVSNKFQRRIQPTVSIPTVVVVRDLFDATTSGYLYHKKGHECWLDPNGLENSKLQHPNDWLSKRNWAQDITNFPLPMYDNDTTSVVPYSNNLCLALAASNETVGMGIYLEFARKHIYESAATLNRRREDPTLFVCLEELTNDPDQLEDTIRSFLRKLQNEHRIHSNARILPRGNRHGIAEKGRQESTDGNNPVQRDHLRAIAMDLDCQYFGCETKIWNDSFNCTSEAERRQNDKTKTIGDDNKKSAKEEDIAHLLAIDKEDDETMVATIDAVPIQVLQWVVVIILGFLVFCRGRKRSTTQPPNRS